jgi:uncharacterized membrane protein (DUF373 family)
VADPITPEEQVPQSGRRARLRRATGGGPSLDIYGWFEQAAALVLIFLVSGIIIAGIARLIFVSVRDVFFPLGGSLGSIESNVFRDVFGMTLGVIIGLEFNHTILSILRREESIVQLRTVVLIAILAMARKFIIVDMTELEPLTIIGLALAILALGCVYWLLRGQERG